MKNQFLEMRTIYNKIHRAKLWNVAAINFSSLIYPKLLFPTQRLECSPMARETWVQSQVESYQRL